MNKKKISRIIFFLIIGMALIACLPKPAMADEILWEYTGLIIPKDADRLDNGNTLITEYGNNRVIEVTPDLNIVWEYNTGLNQPWDADRLSNGNTLISDEWNNRVIEVDQSGTIVWEYSLGWYYPMDADRLVNGNTLISTHNMEGSKIIEVDPSGSEVWQFYTYMYYPQNADRLPSGNTLFADGFGNGAVEITLDGTVVWQYGSGAGDADRLTDGNTLIAETGNDRVIEVTTDGTIVWEYNTGLNNPFDADRLENGNTLIADRDNNRIIEVGTAGIIGDFNSDGYVDAADLQLLGDHWHFVDTDPGWDALYDLVPDGFIDAADLQVFGDHWHEGTPPRYGQGGRNGRGPNEFAGIVFDLDATTTGNQNLTGIPSQPPGTYIRVDVYCTDVQNLDTYEFEVIYNPTELEYVTTSATNPITFEPNILTTNGGTALGWMIDTSTPGVLSIAYTLAGTDPLEAPEGEGLIADIVFLSLVDTYGTLSFGDVYYYDSFGVMDLITDTGTASFLPDPPENVNIEIVADGDSVKITWDNEGLEYNIYSDEDPYGLFETHEATVNDIGEVIISIVGLKKFYRITASN